MRSIQFSKWDPSGNTTLFFPQDTPGNHAALAHRALLQQKLGGEQARFDDTQNGSLIMAGGEFCHTLFRGSPGSLRTEAGHPLFPVLSPCLSRACFRMAGQYPSARYGLSAFVAG